MSSTSLTFHQLRPIRVVEVCHKERRFQICFKIFEDIVVSGTFFLVRQAKSHSPSSVLPTNRCFFVFFFLVENTTELV